MKKCLQKSALKIIMCRETAKKSAVKLTLHLLFYLNISLTQPCQQNYGTLKMATSYYQHSFKSLLSGGGRTPTALMK